MLLCSGLNKGIFVLFTKLDCSELLHGDAVIPLRIYTLRKGSLHQADHVLCESNSTDGALVWWNIGTAANPGSTFTIAPR